MFVELLSRPRLQEAQLVRAALELGAAEVGGPLSVAEREAVGLALAEDRLDSCTIASIRDQVELGMDPLGDDYCRSKSAPGRRATGMFYTPPQIVEPMVEWALGMRPSRVVDAGCGSGRFALSVARRVPEVELVAMDLDPIATLLTRANLAVVGCKRATVIQGSYLTTDLGSCEGKTAFLSNPPYVRHHQLTVDDKSWAARTGRRLGYRVSGLSGLHLYFYLATMLHAKRGDVGCFVTSAEWLDVGYGAALRQLFLDGLGGQSLHLVDSRSAPFDDVQTTALISCFQIGDEPSAIRWRLLRSLDDVQRLSLGEPLPREELRRMDRWTSLFRGTDPSYQGRDRTPLRAIARVHRGVVTGGNDYFALTRQRARELGLERWCRPAITEGREILDAGGVVRDAPERKLLLDLPRDIDRLAHPAVDAYLRTGEAARPGQAPVADGYICSHRKPWWYMGRREPAPIVASYMARQAPAFALNPDGLMLLNVGHGIYPRTAMSPQQLSRLASALNTARESFRGRGRTYQGGLEKFEPGEMEALLLEWNGDE